MAHNLWKVTLNVLGRVISVYLDQYHSCWCPGSLRRQDISNHDIDYKEYLGPCLTLGRNSITCVMSIWDNGIRYRYMYMIPLKNLARKGLNDDKADFTIITTIETTRRQGNVVNIGESPIALCVRPPSNICVLFASSSCLNDHVNKIYQDVNYRLYSIDKIRKYLGRHTTEKMKNSAVTSHSNYCSSLLYGINGYSVSQLQRFQNNAGRIVFLQRKYDDITPVMKELHWLIAEQRRINHIASLQDSTWHGATLLVIIIVAREASAIWGQTSPDDISLSPGRRCFAHASPSLSSTLPIYIRYAQAIDTLKSSLFNVAFS